MATPAPASSAPAPAPAPTDARDPLVVLAELRFRHARAPTPETLGAIVRLCEEKDLWGLAAATADVPRDAVDRLERRRAAKLAELEAKIAEAKEKHGQVEITDAQLARASYAARTGARAEAAAFHIADDFDMRVVSSGKHIDLVLERLCIAFAWDDGASVKKHVAEALKLLESGGDWDRRNRLKVYQGLQALVARDLNTAAREFLSGVATFTAEELFTYERFILYTVLASLVALDRVDLKKKVVDSAEILGVVDPIEAALAAPPPASGSGSGSASASASTSTSTLASDRANAQLAGRLLLALYECRYRDFFVALVDVHGVLEADPFLARHVHWFVRELRVRAYAQYLASYRSVKLPAMAETFGVSPAFLERELAALIASKRLNAKIDAPAGVVETNQPDKLNAQYQAVIKHGDALLNRIQKLAKVINV